MTFPTAEPSDVENLTAHTYAVGRRKMKERPLPFGTRIPARLQDRLRTHAAESGVNVNDVVERALTEYLAKVRKTEPLRRLKIPRRGR